MIVSILANSLTPVERSMRDMGEQQRLRDIRLMFQHATETQFREAVERITGRRVVGFMSGIDVDLDLACEVFTLEPVSGARERGRFRARHAELTRGPGRGRGEQLLAIASRVTGGGDFWDTAANAACRFPSRAIRSRKLSSW